VKRSRVMADFWLDDDDDGLAVGGSQLSQLSHNPLSQLSTNSASQQQASSQTSALALQKKSSQEFVCEQCEGTEYYYDDTTNANVCSACFTQSQSQLLNGEDDVDEMQATLGAKMVTGAGVARMSSGKTNTRESKPPPVPGSRRRDLDTFDKSEKLPTVDECLEAMKMVIKKCLQTLTVDLLEMEANQREETGAIAKHIFLSYVQSWAQGADRYGELFPEIRFSFRDLFLKPKMSRAIYIGLLEHLLMSSEDEVNEAKEKIESKSSSSSGGKSNKRKRAKKKSRREKGGKESKKESKNPANLKENSKMSSGTDTASDTNNGGNASTSIDTHTASDKKGDQESITGQVNWEAQARVSKRKSAPPDGSRQTYIYRLAIHNGPNRNKIGREEAALILHPSMTMVAAILWLSVARRGVMAHQILDWIAQGSLPLKNAIDHCFTGRRRTKLRLASHSFRMLSLPTPYTMERVSSLLLVAAGLKSNDAFTGLAMPKSARGLIRTLPVNCIPVCTAQIVADLGLEQPVVDTALALMGAIQCPPDSQDLPPKLRFIDLNMIHSVKYIVAIILCAIELQPDWRRLIVGQARHVLFQSPDTDIPLSKRPIPWTDTELNQLSKGAEFHSYLQFCEESLEVCEEKSKAFADTSFSGDNERLSSVESDEVADEEEDQSTKDSEKRTATTSVILCRAVAGVSLAGKPRPSALEIRILSCLKPGRKRKYATMGRMVELEAQENLLLEFLSYSTRIKSRDILNALAEILYIKGID